MRCLLSTSLIAPRTHDISHIGKQGQLSRLCGQAACSIPNLRPGNTIAVGLARLTLLAPEIARISGGANERCIGPGVCVAGLCSTLSGKDPELNGGHSQL